MHVYLALRLSKKERIRYVMTLRVSSALASLALLADSDFPKHYFLSSPLQRNTRQNLYGGGGCTSPTDLRWALQAAAQGSECKCICNMVFPG